MCLSINRRKHRDLKPLIATKDIYTLKAASYENEKYCRSYYEKDKQYFNKLLPKINIIPCNTRIEEGYHSLLNNFTYSLIDNNFDKNYMFNRCIVLCKIPKGTKYFIGEGHDIVSEQLELIQPIIICNISNISRSNIFEIESVKQYEYMTKTLFKDCVKRCKDAGYKIGL